MSQLFQRFSGFLSSTTRRATSAIASLVRSGGSQSRPIAEPEEDEFLTLIRQEAGNLMRSTPLQDIQTNNGLIRFESVPGRLDQLSIAPGEWPTADVTLVDPQGRIQRLSFYGATGRGMNNAQLTRGILTRLWDIHGDNVHNTGLRPTQWIQNVTIDVQVYRTTFIRTR